MGQIFRIYSLSAVPYLDGNILAGLQREEAAPAVVSHPEFCFP